MTLRPSPPSSSTSSSASFQQASRLPLSGPSLSRFSLGLTRRDAHNPSVSLVPIGGQVSGDAYFRDD